MRAELTSLGQTRVASDGLPARSTGSWVRDKKYYVGRYLDIFTRAVGKKWDGLAYVDLFAGPGQNVIRQTNESVDGSPLWALGQDFARYVFVDVPEVLLTLKSRLANHPKLPLIKFVEGDCNAVIERVLRSVPANYLTLVFVDPTGLQIQFSTLAKQKHRPSNDPSVWHGRAHESSAVLEDARRGAHIFPRKLGLAQRCGDGWFSFPGLSPYFGPLLRTPWRTEL
jgi:hypothetical protein